MRTWLMMSPVSMRASMMWQVAPESRPKSSAPGTGIRAAQVRQVRRVHVDEPPVGSAHLIGGQDIGTAVGHQDVERGLAQVAQQVRLAGDRHVRHPARGELALEVRALDREDPLEAQARRQHLLEHGEAIAHEDEDDRAGSAPIAVDDVIMLLVLASIVARSAEAIHVSGKDEPLAGGHTLLPYEAVLASGRVAPDGSLERIYLGAGVLDGLSPAAAVQLLQRCHRALAPDGVLRIATDDLDAVLDRVTSRAIWDESGLPADGFDWGASRFHFLNHAFRQRTWFYNETELRRLATMVGFRDGRRVSAADDTRFQIERLKANLVVVEFRRLRREDGPRPSVDILIPLYRPDHFAHALESALEQTWEPLTIVVCDDGPGDAAARNNRRFPPASPLSAASSTSRSVRRRATPPRTRSVAWQSPAALTSNSCSTTMCSSPVASKRWRPACAITPMSRW